MRDMVILSSLTFVGKNRGAALLSRDIDDFRILSDGHRKRKVIGVLF